MRYFDSLIPETCVYFDDRVIRYSNFLLSYYVVLISRNNLIYDRVSEVLDMSKNNLCYNQECAIVILVVTTSQNQITFFKTAYQNYVKTYFRKSIISERNCPTIILHAVWKTSLRVHL